MTEQQLADIVDRIPLNNICVSDEGLSGKQIIDSGNRWVTEDIMAIAHAIRAATLEEAAQWHEAKAEANALEGRDTRVTFHRSSAVQLRELARDGSSEGGNNV